MPACATCADTVKPAHRSGVLSYQSCTLENKSEVSSVFHITIGKSVAHVAIHADVYVTTRQSFT